MKAQSLALLTFSVVNSRPSHNPQSQWQRKASYPGPSRHHPVTFANATHGFLLTGSCFSANGYSLEYDNLVYVYNKKEDSWTESNTPFPGEPRSFAYGIAVDSRNAYVGFGASEYDYLHDLWHLDMLTMEWTRLADCDCVGRRHPAMAAVEGKIYVGLGDGVIDGQWQNLKDFHEYDISTDTWRQIDDFRLSKGIIRFTLVSTTPSTLVWATVGMGSSAIGTSSMQTHPGWHFPTSRVTAHAKRVAGTQGTVQDCKLGFVLSGDGDNHSYMKTGEFHVYSEDSWTSLTPHPGRSRWAPGSFVIGTEVFFTSGMDRKARMVFNDLWSIGISHETACMS